MTNNISSIGNANCGTSELNPSNAHDAHEVHNAHHVAATNKNDDVSSIGNRSRVSAHSIVQSLTATMKDSLLRPFQHRQGLATSSSVCGRINSVLRGGIPCNPPSQVLFAQPTIVHRFDPCGTPNADAASTADTAHTQACHAPPMTFEPSDVNLLMSNFARNGHSTGPSSHAPTHAPVTGRVALIPVEPLAFRLFPLSVENL